MFVSFIKFNIYKEISPFPICSNVPFTNLHCVPSPLHIPHLSCTAFESKIQSHPTFYIYKTENKLNLFVKFK